MRWDVNAIQKVTRLCSTKYPRFLKFKDGAIVTKFDLHYESPRIFSSLVAKNYRVLTIIFFAHKSKNCQTRFRRKRQCFLGLFWFGFNSKLFILKLLLLDIPIKIVLEDIENTSRKANFLTRPKAYCQVASWRYGARYGVGLICELIVLTLVYK